jgi:hypothetical protein
MVPTAGRRTAGEAEPLSESQIQNRILLECGRGDTRLFRQNVGQGWVGRLVRRQAGTVELAAARPLHAGLCDGSSDLIGWRTVEVTPDMVGQRLAVFAAIEVKSATGRPTPEQTAFLAAVRDAGGVACVARSVEDAQRALIVGD